MGRATPLRAEYDDSPEIDHRAVIWRGLEWMRISDKRKMGWSAHFYKDLFGEWPPSWFKTLLPVEPSKALRLAVNRRNAAFKKQKRLELEAKRGSNGNAGGTLSGSAAKTADTRGRAGRNGAMES